MCGCVFEMDLDDDLSWLTQRSPEMSANFDLLSDSEDDITVDETNAGLSVQSFVSLEEGPIPIHNSTEIYDGVFAEDISSDEDVDNM